MPTTIEYKLDWKNVGYRMQYTGETNYTFTDQEIDRETGLMYYNARYYNPSLGRFLQEDPVYNGNPYIYVSNNPLKYTDPDGKRRRKVNAERQNLMRQWRKTNARIAARNQFRAGLFKDFQRYVNFGQFSAAEVKYMTSTVNTQVDRLNQRDLDMMYRREGIYRKNKARRSRGYVANVSYGKTISQIKFERKWQKIARVIAENDSREKMKESLESLYKNDPKFAGAVEEFLFGNDEVGVTSMWTNPNTTNFEDAVHIVYVHGTWSSSSTAYDDKEKDRKFLFQSFLDLGGDIGHNFQWENRLTDSSRTEASRKLIDLLNGIPAHQKVIIVAHSHGSNVVKESSNSESLKRDIDFLVSLGGPVRDDYKEDRGRIKKIANVYSEYDPVQTFDFRMETTCGWRCHTYPVPSERRIKDEGLNYRNFNVSNYGKPNHSELHQIDYWLKFRETEHFKYFFN